MGKYLLMSPRKNIKRGREKEEHVAEKEERRGV
jgi:hypothetical protein